MKKDGNYLIKKDGNSLMKMDGNSLRRWIVIPRGRKRKYLFEKCEIERDKEGQKFLNEVGWKFLEKEGWKDLKREDQKENLY